MHLLINLKDLLKGADVIISIFTCRPNFRMMIPSRLEQLMNRSTTLKDSNHVPATLNAASTPLSHFSASHCSVDRRAFPKWAIPSASQDKVISCMKCEGKCYILFVWVKNLVYVGTFHGALWRTGTCRKLTSTSVFLANYRRFFVRLDVANRRR